MVTVQRLPLGSMQPVELGLAASLMLYALAPTLIAAAQLLQ